MSQARATVKVIKYPLMTRSVTQVGCGKLKAGMHGQHGLPAALLLISDHITTLSTKADQT